MILKRNWDLDKFYPLKKSGVSNIQGVPLYSTPPKNFVSDQIVKLEKKLVSDFLKNWEHYKSWGVAEHPGHGPPCRAVT